MFNRSSARVPNPVSPPLLTFLCTPFSQLKLGPVIQMGGGGPGPAPALARTLSSSGPVVALARLPPLRKLAAVIMTHALRQALLHLDDVIIAAADNTPATGTGSTGAGAGAATGSTGTPRQVMSLCSANGGAPCCPLSWAVFGRGTASQG